MTSADALEVAIPSAVLGAVFVTLLVARHAVAPGLLQSIRMISPDKDQEYAVMLVAIVSVLGLTGVAAILVVVFLAWAVPLFS